MSEEAPSFLPSPMLKAIGNLAAYWAYMESSVEVAIWCFLSIPRELGAPVTTHMAMVSRCQALRVLAMRRFGKESLLFQKFDELLAKIEFARIQRNEIIHAFWKHTPEGEAVPTLKSLREAYSNRKKRKFPWPISAPP